jgi:hypothetical protein
MLLGLFDVFEEDPVIKVAIRPARRSTTHPEDNEDSFYGTNGGARPRSIISARSGGEPPLCITRDTLSSWRK